MGRPTPDLHAARDLAQRATAARKSWEKQHRHMSDERMAAEIFSLTGVYFNRGTLGKLWTGRVDPHSVGIETILAIARFLEVDPDELGPVIAERRRQVFALSNPDPDAQLTGAGVGGRSLVSWSDADPAHRQHGLHRQPADFTKVAPHLAGVVQRQNISFPNWYSGETTQRQLPTRSVFPPFGP